VAGLYYFDSEVDGTGTRLDLGGLGDVNFDVAYLQDTTSYAVFGQFDYAFNEQWQVVAGLRYTDEEKDYTYINTETNFGAFVYEFSPATVGSLASQSDDVVSGKLGLNYRPTEDWLVFASVSTAFKSGGFNAGFLDPSLDFSNMPFDKEELTSFELGFKWANASDTIRLNTTAFYYDYEDLQALSFEGVSSFISNASDAEIYGAEFELIASPVENFEMILGLGILDASADGISLADGSVLQNRNLVLAPDLQMNGLARYSVPMGASALVFQVDATYSDEVYFDIVNQPVARQSSYSVWNAQVSYQINHNFEVSGWVRNLTDEEYKVYTFDFSDFFGFNQQFYGPPRWYGVSLSYQY
ncbi:MAG: TonB-dependent receptor, partial [Arenicellales bacterium]|nr:TonB-dependent receptor [Arenicellales bacterium]